MEIKFSLKNIIGILKRDKYFEIDDKNKNILNSKMKNYT